MSPRTNLNPDNCPPDLRLHVAGVCTVLTTRGLCLEPTPGMKPFLFRIKKKKKMIQGLIVGCSVSKPVLLLKPRGGNQLMFSTGAWGIPVNASGGGGGGSGVGRMDRRAGGDL